MLFYLGPEHPLQLMIKANYRFLPNGSFGCRSIPAKHIQVFRLGCAKLGSVRSAGSSMLFALSSRYISRWGKFAGHSASRAAHHAPAMSAGTNSPTGDRLPSMERAKPRSPSFRLPPSPLRLSRGRHFPGRKAPDRRIDLFRENSL